MRAAQKFYHVGPAADAHMSSATVCEVRHFVCDVVQRQSYAADMAEKRGADRRQLNASVLSPASYAWTSPCAAGFC